MRGGRWAQGAAAMAAVTAAMLAVQVGVAIAEEGAGEYAVSLVASDDPELASPAPRDQELSAEQVEDMVRRAVDLVGGMSSVVPDTARLVLIKPNITIAQPRGSGIVAAIMVWSLYPRAVTRLSPIWLRSPQ